MPTEPALSENSNATVLCGTPMAVVHLTAQARAALYRGVFWNWGKIRLDDLVVQTLMVSFDVAMGNEFIHGLPQRQITEEDLAIQTRFLDRSHKSKGTSWDS